MVPFVGLAPSFRLCKASSHPSFEAQGEQLSRPAAQLGPRQPAAGGLHPGAQPPAAARRAGRGRAAGGEGVLEELAKAAGKDLAGGRDVECCWKWGSDRGKACILSLFRWGESEAGDQRATGSTLESTERRF